MWILMSVFSWGQIFPRSIALNRNYFQDHSDTLSLWLPSPKSQMMGTLRTKASREASWGGQQLSPSSPCSLPSDLWCVTSYFSVGTSAAQKCRLVGMAGQGAKASITCCPTFPCPCGRWAPMAALEKSSCCLAQPLPFLGAATPSTSE